jgi:DNA-binding MarR family transcriptional regulator
MAGGIGRAIQQKTFSSSHQEVLLGLLIAAARVIEPWEKFLKANAGLSNNQYNVLRILRGSHPAKLACSEIATRMIDRDPDVTRLVDRLSRQGLVTRSRSRNDRRVVEVGLTDKGQELLKTLDPHAGRMPKAVVGHLSAAKLTHLKTLLDQVLEGMGGFP